MPRPSRTIIKKSVLQFTQEERDLGKKTEVKKTSKNTSRINDDKPIFKLKLPKELVKDLGKSSEGLLNIYSPIQSSIRPTIEILSSDDEYLTYDDHSSPTEMGRKRSPSPIRTLSSMEDNGEISSLVISRNLSQGNTQKDKKESSDDEFGFAKAEKKIMKKNGTNNQKISNNYEKSDQVIIIENENFQSHIIKSISLIKETDGQNYSDTDDYDDFLLEPGIENQNEAQRKQNNEESNIDNVDKNHSQPNLDEDHLSAENDKISVNLSSIKIQKPPTNITKTVDLIASILPPRRRIKRDNEKVLDHKKKEPSQTIRKRKIHSEYKTRKVKKETHSLESIDDDNKEKEARAIRILHFEEIDKVVLPIE
ncbi:4977_t:CDS:2 [Funneliformis mosseae]|uniref:4977_t:CDS:1 n=1 Tax=Funneliformis mosseae TaxID=27381 RepID=A0A9N9G6T8_FUNMO|nr:4977_t:CDS:2 [Funneliformis mosseae]